MEHIRFFHGALQLCHCKTFLFELNVFCYILNSISDVTCTKVGYSIFHYSISSVFVRLNWLRSKYTLCVFINKRVTSITTALLRL